MQWLLIKSFIWSSNRSSFSLKVIADNSARRTRLWIFGGISLFTIKLIQYSLNSVFYYSLSALGLFLVFYLIKLFGDRAFKRESLGGGDVKLAIIIGFVLGFEMGLFNILIASVLAFPVALVVTLHKKIREIPFGPFLVTGLFVMFIKFDLFKELMNTIFVW